MREMAQWECMRDKFLAQAMIHPTLSKLRPLEPGSSLRDGERRTYTEMDTERMTWIDDDSVNKIDYFSAKMLLQSRVSAVEVAFFTWLWLVLLAEESTTFEANRFRKILNTTPNIKRIAGASHSSRPTHR